MEAEQGAAEPTAECGGCALISAKKMKPILTLLLLGFLSACGEKSPSDVAGLAQWEGKEVTVYFRRDVLGAAGTPISPIATWSNHSMVSLDGKIITAGADGVFLDSRYKMNAGDTELHHAVFWIPNESILSVKSEK